MSVGVGRSHHGDEDGRDHDDKDETQVELLLAKVEVTYKKIKGT